MTRLRRVKVGDVFPNAAWVNDLVDLLNEVRAAVVPPEFISVTEAAELLGTTRQAVHQRIQSGSLPATKVGNTWVIDRSDVTGGQP